MVRLCSGSCMTVGRHLHHMYTRWCGRRRSIRQHLRIGVVGKLFIRAVGIDLLGDISLGVVGILGDSVEVVDDDGRQTVGVIVECLRVAQGVGRLTGRAQAPPVGADGGEVAVRRR